VSSNELKGMQSYAVSIVALAAIVLVGLAVLFVFSKTLRVNTAVDITGVTVPAVNASVNIGTTGQYPYLQTVTNCYNSTNASDLYTAAMYSVNEGTDDGGSIMNLDAGAGLVGETVNCSITYLGDTTAQGTANTFITGITIFATFIGVIVLALIGKIIISLFRKND